MSQLGPDSSPVAWELTDYLSNYAPTDKLLVNPGSLSRLAMWGSFKPTVTVTGEAPEANVATSAEPQDDDTPSVSGINADGSAVAGLSLHRRKKPEYGSVTIHGRVDEDGDVIDPQSDMLNCRRVPLTLNLDVPTIESALSDQRALRDPGAWSEMLDTTLRRQTVEATKKHLSGGNISRFLLVGQRVSFMAWALALSAKFDTPLGWQYAALESLPVIASTAKKTTDLKQHGFRNPEKCYSFLWPQVDRIPATALLARLPMSRVIKPA